MRTLIFHATTLLLLAALILSAQGCQTQTTVGGIVQMPSQPMPVARTVKVRSAHTPREGPNEPADLADPCSARLQDMIGPLYEYYILHQRLPDNLEDLHTVADIGMDLNFTCPATGKPYIYNPVGLRAPGSGTLNIILYDATPAHNGHRWAVMAGQARNKQNAIYFETFVVNLSEKDFGAYKPIPPPSTQPAEVTPADPQAQGQGAQPPLGGSGQ